MSKEAVIAPPQELMVYFYKSICFSLNKSLSSSIVLNLPVFESRHSLKGKFIEPECFLALLLFLPHQLLSKNDQLILHLKFKNQGLMDFQISLVILHARKSHLCP